MRPFQLKTLLHEFAVFSCDAVTMFMGPKWLKLSKQPSRDWVAPTAAHLCLLSLAHYATEVLVGEHQLLYTYTYCVCRP